MTATSFVWNLKKPSHKETTMLGAASAVEVQVGHNSANECHSRVKVPLVDVYMAHYAAPTGSKSPIAHKTFNF